MQFLNRSHEGVEFVFNEPISSSRLLARVSATRELRHIVRKIVSPIPPIVL